jgi:hypothetical protein
VSLGDTTEHSVDVHSVDVQVLPVEFSRLGDAPPGMKFWTRWSCTTRWKRDPLFAKFCCSCSLRCVASMRKSITCFKTHSFLSNSSGTSGHLRESSAVILRTLLRYRISHTHSCVYPPILFAATARARRSGCSTRFCLRRWCFRVDFRCP